MNCPHCNVFIDREMIGRIFDGAKQNYHSGRIVPGIVMNERYEIKEELGRGGMGVVYRARDLYMDRDVALKLIPRELSMDPKAVSDLKQETALALDLTHEFIVRLYNLDAWGNLTFVTMEYVPCGTLSHLMVEKGGTIPIQEVLPLLRQVAEALDYAHNKKPPVVHLDLKPLNILITIDGCAKIADFGLARVLRDLATRVSAWEAAGSLAYMAPEQIRGKGIGKWTDIYALAAVAYEVISGQPPFYTGDLRWQIMHEKVEEIEGVPEHVNKALLSGLAKDKSLRPESAGDFVEMLAGEKSAPEIKAEEEAPDSDKISRDAAKKKRKKQPEGGEKRQKRPIFIYAIIAFLCLIVLGELGLILYRQDVLNSKITEYIAGVLKWDIKKALEPENMMFKIPDPAGKKGVQAIDKGEFIKGNEALLKGKPETPPTGELAVISSPSQAEIYVNDIRKGVTPVILKDLPEGSCVLMVKKEGFETWQDEVTIIPFEISEVGIDLTPLYGKLEIKSVPEKADVYIGEENFGSTPLLIDKVEKGVQQVEVKKDGFRTWKEEVDIAAGKMAEVTAELMPIRGSLYVTSKPRDADVYVSGKKIGQTPIKLEGLQQGEILVEVRKDCYEPSQNAVKVSTGQAKKSRFNLNPICGSFSVKSIPEGSDWYLDGRLMGKTPGDSGMLERGVYKIKVKKDNYSDWELAIDIHAGKKESVVASLEEIVSVSGVSSVSNVFENSYRDAITGMEFIWVEKGCFNMGSPLEESGRGSDESPVHEVCIDGIWIGKYEVTQGQWQKVMGENLSFFQKGDEYPVENVSWEDSQEFIRKLNLINKGKAVYRLPTEAEWEYACRSGGKKEEYSGGKEADSVAWYKGNGNETTHPVGSKKPSGIGLFDMSGNVFEWVEDVYLADAYIRHKRINPVYKGEGNYRVCRGGSWLLSEKECRCSNRSYYFGNSRNYNLGFRIVKNP
jgi:formylglycine-generating enzyme required for sulfatase activity/serine/threonine protein kinase